MREKKPCLTFAISNSPVIILDGNHHGHFEHTAENSQVLQKYKDIYKIVCPLPKEHRFFIGKYLGGNNLKIFRTQAGTSLLTSKYPYRLTVTKFVYAGPRQEVEEVDVNIFYGNPFSIKQSWEVFHELAWQEDVYAAVSAMSPDMVDCELFAISDFAACHETARSLLNYGGSDDVVLFLNMIRDYPDVLRVNEVRDLLIDLLKYSKQGHNKHDETKASDLIESFHENFIPKSNKITATRKMIAEELIANLVEHLNKRCKVDSKIIIKKKNGDRKGRTLDEVTYNKLIQWAKDNNEARIATMVRVHPDREDTTRNLNNTDVEDISTLLCSTPAYIRNSLKKCFGITSDKHLGRF